MRHLRCEWHVVLIFYLICCGCSGSQSIRIPRAAPEPTVTARPSLPEVSDWGWSDRLVTEDELTRLEMMDPSMDGAVTRRILARLNSKADFHVYDDIRKGKPLRAPNDFRAYRDWTPLPRQTDKLAHLSKAILVVKDIPFIGWYENGKLVGDSLVGLGVPGEETEAGVYGILEKAEEKYSLSYRNPLGEPAWMPWAMRIYRTVWIHAGDISEPYCSHGCVMLPMDSAKELYYWSDQKTTVVVVESLAALNQPPRVKTKSSGKR